MELLTKTKKFIRLLTGTFSPAPQDVQLEITNRCNFACPICPRNLMKVPAQDMPWPLFHRVIQNVGRPHAITLTGWGEPLMHADFCRVIAYLNQKIPQAKIKFTTNGSLLNPQLIIKLLKLRIAEIHFSLDTVHQKSESHGGAAKLSQNVEALRCGRGPRANPRIFFQSVISPDALPTLRNIIRLGKKLQVDQINLMRLEKIFDPDLKRPDFPKEQQILRAAYQYGRKGGIRIFSFNTFHPLLYCATHGERFCLRRDNHVYITVEGKVTPCCNLRQLVCGDLTREPLAAIWRNQNFHRFRAQEPGICARCDALTWKQKI